MHKDTAKQQIRHNISCKNYLTKSKGGLYKCPFCGSGDGIHHTGALKLYDTNTWTCHSCKRSGDVLDLIQKVNGVDYITAFNMAADELGLQIDPYTPAADPNSKQDLTVTENNNKSFVEPEQKSSKTDIKPSKTTDYTEYYKNCALRLKNSPEAISYLLARGISLNTAYAYNLGFDPQADPAHSGHKTPRIIIPTSKTHYIGRSIDPTTQKAYQKINVKGSAPGIFNSDALFDNKNKVVFVCEGVFDALSVAQIGLNAIALNSTSNTGRLLELIKQKPTQVQLIICFDNDPDPNTSAKTKTYANELKKGLTRLNVKSCIFNICGCYKDPNEALSGDKESFQNAAEAALAELNRDYLTDFLEKIQTDAYKPFTTGISFFDNLLGGGVIQQSLLLLMAAPGTGKTTLVQQIAEAIAEQKTPVVYLNLEMSREQMFAKAISGRLYKKNPLHNKTALEILQGYRWSDKDKSSIIETIQDYRQKVYPFIRYNPDEISSDLETILQYLHSIGENAKTLRKQAPVVIVDYLHLISSRLGLDVQELIKQAVTGLKEYAKNYNTFVIGIVATNRISNTSGKITMESGRDSSNIEYTGDYQLSLNYCEIDSGEVKATDVEKIARLQQRKWRQMIIRVLKGRLCAPGKAVKVYFNAANNVFYGEDEFIPVDDQQSPFYDPFSPAVTGEKTKRR